MDVGAAVVAGDRRLRRRPLPHRRTSRSRRGGWRHRRLIFAQIPFAGPDGFDFGAAFDNAYGVVPFLAWIPNLIVAEWLIRRRGLPSYRITPTIAREPDRAPIQTLEAAVSTNRV